MYISKVSFLAIIVKLLFIGALVTSASIGDAAARPILHESEIQAVQPATLQFINHTGTLAYDSGWNTLGTRPDPISVEFTHAIGGDPDGYIVHLECRYSLLGTYNCTDNMLNVNALWYDLTSTTIKIWVSGNRPDSVRVRIYTAPPAYDSGWKALGARPDPISVEFTHAIGGDPDAYYIVRLECRDNTSLGTYNCTDHQFNVNALWYDLTSTTIKVWVNRLRPENARVRIYTASPAYDTGWKALGARPDPISVEITHSLGGDPGRFIVSLECRDNTSLGIYNCTDQGFKVNAMWYGLINTTIKVFATGGIRPDDVRVRIWQTHTVYLPTIIRAFEAP